MAIDFDDEENGDLFARDGTSLFTKAVQIINNKLDGVSLVSNDPSNPLYLLLESASIIHADTTLAVFNVCKRIHPKMATTRRELYHALNDNEFKDAFASPSNGKLKLAFRLTEIKKTAIASTSGVSVVTLPEGTMFTFNEVRFMLTRPVIIRLLKNEGIQVLYGSSLNNQYTYESNLLDYAINIYRGSDNIEFKLVELTLDVKQLTLIAKQETASESSGYSKEYAITDQFSFCKVYTLKTTGWVELNVTYSNLNYDIEVPTACVRVYSDAVSIKIPDVYFTKGLISTTVLIEIYTTKGDLTFNLAEYTSESGVTIGIPEGVYQTKTQPIEIGQLKNLTTKICAGMNTTSQGVDMLSFKELKDRHINQAVDRTFPVTNVQITNSLNYYGFDISLAENILTKRLYLATKALPTNTYSNYLTSATTTMGTLTTTFSQLIQNEYVITNTKRATIQPSALYSVDGQSIVLQERIVVEPLKDYSADELINFFNQGIYGVCPFYHVVDVTGNVTTYRSYQLDKPTINSRIIVSTDNSSEIIIGTKTASISFNEPDYKIYVVSKINGSFDKTLAEKITAELSFTTSDGSYTGLVKGVRGDINTNGESIWIFTLNTKLDIDDENQLHLLNVDVSTGQTLNTSIALSTNLIIEYKIPSDNETLVISTEEMNVTFGKHLDKLYNRAHVTKTTTDYKKYDVDVYDTYSEDDYELDVRLNIPKYTVDTTGNPVFNIRHKKGDLILDDLGNPVIKYHAGDFITNEDGSYIPINNEDLEFSIDLLMINAVYRYASHQNDIDYYKDLGTVLVGYMDDYIDLIKKELIGLTEIQYYPSINIGDVKVTGSNGEQSIISGALSFEVTIQLTEDKYKSTKYRDEIKTSVTSMIHDSLKERSISITGLTKTLLTSLSDEVIGLSIASPDLSLTVPTYTLVNTTESFTLKRILERQSSGTTKVAPSITFTWVK